MKGDESHLQTKGKFMNNHTQLQSNRTPSTKLGYFLHNPTDANRVAYAMATDLVKDSLILGITLRAWVEEAKSKTDYLLKLSEHLAPRKENSGGLQNKDQQALSDIVFWENEIAQVVRSYFLKISDLMNRVKVLNPPLTSQQLDPYIEAILADRRKTLSTLEPLSAVIEKIAKLKSLFYCESPLNSQRMF